MVALMDVVEAVSNRERFTVVILPPVRRWRKVLDHLASAHPEDVATTDPNAVVRPELLSHWHDGLHQDHYDRWMVEGTSPRFPHKHLGRLGRLANWWQWR